MISINVAIMPFLLLHSPMVQSYCGNINRIIFPPYRKFLVLSLPTESRTKEDILDFYPLTSSNPIHISSVKTIKPISSRTKIGDQR